MVVPVIAAAAAATKGAATIAISEKAAKATASAFTSIKEITEMGGFQQLENFANSVKNSGPVAAAFSQLGAKLKIGTIESLVDLMERLMAAFESEAGKDAIHALIRLMNFLITGSADIVAAIDRIMNFLYELFSFGKDAEGAYFSYEHPAVPGYGDQYYVPQSTTVPPHPLPGGG